MQLLIMGLQFRKSKYIPDFAYRTIALPKTLKQCAYLIEQKQVELQSTQERENLLRFQKQLFEDDKEDLEVLEISDKIRSVRNAQATLRNQLILLNQWRKDFVNIAEIPEKKRKSNKTIEEIKELKIKIHELEQQVKSIDASKSLKRLACQAEQFARQFAQLVFLPSEPISPMQILDLQRITRVISGKEPDHNFTELMQPFIDIAKSDRLKREEERDFALGG